MPNLQRNNTPKKTGCIGSLRDIFLSVTANFVYAWLAGLSAGLFTAWGFWKEPPVFATNKLIVAPLIGNEESFFSSDKLFISVVRSNRLISDGVTKSQDREMQSLMDIEIVYRGPEPGNVTTIAVRDRNATGRATIPSPKLNCTFDLQWTVTESVTKISDLDGALRSPESLRKASPADERLILLINSKSNGGPCQFRD